MKHPVTKKQPVSRKPAPGSRQTPGIRSGNHMTPESGKAAGIRSGNQAWQYLIILFIFSFALYANTLSNGFILDDFGVLKDNWVVRKGAEAVPLILSTPYRYGINMFSDNLYRPFSMIMFAVEWQLSPDNPGLHHLINILFFSFSCCLLYVFLRKLLDQSNGLPAFVITLLWAAHPIHTEVVDNIKSRDEIMSVFFLLLTLLALLHFLRNKGIWSLPVAALCYFLALMSKEGVVTMILVFPLIGWYFTNAKLPKNLLGTCLMLLPVLAYLLIRHMVLSRYQVPSALSPADNLLVAAPGIASRLATAILILGKYLFLLIIPFQLVSDCSFNQIPVTGWDNPLVIFSFCIYLAALVYSVVKLKQRLFPVFGILFYLITISLYSNLFILIGTSYGERLLYLPSVGFAMVLAWGLLKAFKADAGGTGFFRMSSLIRDQKVFTLLLTVMLLLYSIRTFTRNFDWKDQYSLFSKDIISSPQSAHLRYYWGLTIRDRAKEQKDPDQYRIMMQQALNEFQKGVEIFPDYPECYHQLGLANFRLGNTEVALKSYERAISLNPFESVPYANMGIIYFQKGDYTKALELYRKSVELDPHYADGHFNLGSTYGMLSQYDSAIRHFRKAIELDPEHANANYFLGITYKNLNKPELAKPYLEKAYQLNPALKPAK